MKNCSPELQSRNRLRSGAKSVGAVREPPLHFPFEIIETAETIIISQTQWPGSRV